MLYSNYKREVLESYGKAISGYNNSHKKAQKEIRRLYERRRISIELILEIETLINSIANSPKEYGVIVRKIEMERKKFHETEEYAEEAFHEALKAGVNIAAGVAGGVVVAAAAPPMAMWIATTFGTASTGTAISALSGAAATNAALSWLGGGSLAAGGTGVAGGQTLLMLAGPIGWVITGGVVVVSTSVLSIKNKRIADKAAEEEQEIRRAMGQLNEVKEKVEHLGKKTAFLYGQARKLYELLQERRGKDFQEFEKDVQFRFGVLVNDTLSLSKLLNETVQEDGG